MFHGKLTKITFDTMKNHKAGFILQQRPICYNLVIKLENISNICIIFFVPDTFYQRVGYRLRFVASVYGFTL